MKLPRLLAIAIGLCVILFAAAFAAPVSASLPLIAQASPLDHAGPVAIALPPASNPWLALIPFAVPLIVSQLKAAVPRLGKHWLPVIAASLGLALALLDHYTGALGGNPQAIAFLGLAGTGVREVYDQLQQRVAASGEQATTPSSKV